MAVVILGTCARESPTTAQEARPAQLVARFALPYYPYVGALTFSPDGERLAFGSFSGLLVVDVPRGKVITDLLEKQVDDPNHPKGIWITDVAFSADGRHVFSLADDGWMFVFDAHTGRQVPIWGRFNDVTALAISSDGELVATCHRDRKLRIRKSKDGSDVRQFRIDEARARTLRFSPDSSTLAFVSDKAALTLVESKSGETRATIPKVLHG